MVFKLDPKKFSELPETEELDGTELVPIVKDGVNDKVPISKIWGENPGDDKNYTQQFTNSDEVTVVHNLGKMPAVTVMDSAGDEVYGSVNHLNENELVVLFSSSFTGIITCN